MAIKKPTLPRMKSVSLRKSKTPEDLGVAGASFDRGHPFYFGFVATAGAAVSLTLLRALAGASQVFVLIIISMFFAAGLNPAVSYFQSKKMKRGFAVLTVITLVMAFVGLCLLVIVPPFVNQVNNFIVNAPGMLDNLKHNATINHFNNQYGVVDMLQSKLNATIKDGKFIVSAFGGILGVGKAVLSGTFSVITIIILTLYFTASLPSITRSAYNLVPSSRRDRVSRLSDAIINRIGGFVRSQTIVSTIAGIFALALASILGIHYAMAIGVLVFICGLIPLVGHYIGISLFTIIALTKSPLTGLIVFISYVLYQQIENYFIAPRIMRDTLELPGVVTIIAALLGTSLLGPIGALLAVPIAAAVMLIVEEVIYPKQNAK
jgi:predicted PurR-regulated permease PerM